METYSGFGAERYHSYFRAVFFLGLGMLITNAFALPSPTTHTETTTVASNHSHESTTTAYTHTSTHPTTTLMTPTTPQESTIPPTTPVPTKTIEPCVPQICEEKICRVNGSISRPSFYARCPSPSENEPDADISKYCMCASAYHASATEENQQFYVQITPDVNCQVPETDEDKAHCEQKLCQGSSKKSNRQANICEIESKFYCACFN